MVGPKISRPISDCRSVAPKEAFGAPGSTGCAKSGKSRLFASPTLRNAFIRTMPWSRARYLEAVSTLVWYCSSILEPIKEVDSSSFSTRVSSEVDDWGGAELGASEYALFPGADFARTPEFVDAGWSSKARVAVRHWRNCSISARDCAFSALICSTSVRSCWTWSCRLCTEEAMSAEPVVATAGSCARLCRLNNTTEAAANAAPRRAGVLRIFTLSSYMIQGLRHMGRQGLYPTAPDVRGQCEDP